MINGRISAVKLIALGFEFVSVIDWAHPCIPGYVLRWKELKDQRYDYYVLMEQHYLYDKAGMMKPYLVPTRMVFETVEDVLAYYRDNIDFILQLAERGLYKRDVPAVTMPEDITE